jgi:thioredoxin 1
MKVVDVEASTWDKEVVKSEKPVVVDFWHSLCSWCIKLNPVFEQLPERFGDNVKFVKVNVLHNQETQMLAISQGVFGTPTMKFFCNGRPVGEIVGYRPLDRLVNEIEETLKKKDDCLKQSTPLKA